MKTLMIAIIGCLLLSGCGNDWEMTKKNFKSNYSELLRKVVVYDSFKSEPIWEFTGIVYMSDGSSNGNVSIIYKKDVALRNQVKIKRTPEEIATSAKMMHDIFDLSETGITNESSI